jgi:hypothetical protein
MRSRYATLPIMPRFVDDDRLLSAPQAETGQALRVPRRAAMPAFDQRQPDFVAALCHDFIKPLAYPVISSNVLPRFAAIVCGERMPASAFSVARTTLIGLRDP